MIFDRGRNFLHISIPRTGSTQMNILLQNKNLPEPDEHHMTLEDALKVNPEAAAEDCFRFTFVRNPYDRMVSLYFEFTKNRGRQYSGKVVTDKPLFHEFNQGDDVSSFRNFCCNFQDTEWVDNIFLKPQADFCKSDLCEMSYVGKFENLHQEWENLSEKLIGKRISLANRQKETHREAKPRSSKHLHFAEYYDIDSRFAVQEFYKEDFERFGYEQ
jgi:hypothetical protein